jgi:hypothetical protein
MSGSARPLAAGIVVLFTVSGCVASSSPASSSPPAATAAPATAAPTPAPTATPVPASPTPASPARLSINNIDKALLPGTYRVAGPFGAAFSLAFPTEWTLKALDQGDVEFVNSGGGENGGAWLVVDEVENVFADPCHASGPSNPPVARTVDQIAAALTRMKGYEAGPVTDVMVGSHAGKALEITNTIDTEAAGCAGGPMLPMWTFTGGGSAQTNGGATEQLWVVDVDGTPVIIDGETFSITPKGSREEITNIVSTFDFE